MREALNYLVFTDGSLRHNNELDRNYSSYATAIVNVSTGEYMVFGDELSGRGIAYCEAYAIYKGLSKLVDLTGGRTRALVITDNKLCVDTINVYIPYVWDLSNPHCWRRANGEPVKNQDIFKKIVGLMTAYPELQVKVTHINSHQKVDSYWSAMQSKLGHGGVNVDMDSTKMFMQMNAIVDKHAQRISQNYMNYEREHGEFYRLEPAGP